jgi:hypothetical protein
VAQPPTPQPTPAPAPAPAPAPSPPTVEPDAWAHLTLALLLAVSVVVALVVDGHKEFQANKADFALFAGFYVAAQVVERLLEVVSPLFPFWRVGGTGPTLGERVGKAPVPTGGTELDLIKADRGMIMLGLGTLAGTILSASIGLYFLQAVGMEVDRTIDILASGLVISGGTKSIHELINRIQKPANPPGTPTNG